MTTRYEIVASISNGGRRVSVKTGTEEEISPSRRMENFGIFITIFRNIGEGLEVCKNLDGDSIVYEYVDKTIDATRLGDILQRPMFFAEDGSSKDVDYYGMICLYGSWKHRIGAEQLHVLKNFFGFKIGYSKAIEPEKTNIIGIWGTHHTEKCYSMKVDRKLQFYCDIRNIDLLFTQHSLQMSCHEIGDVTYSILSPEAFTRVHGQGWMLLDGSALPSASPLREECLGGVRTLPDMRGRFARMKDHGKGITDDARIGNLQEDTMKRFKVSVDAGGVHKHHGKAMDESGKSVYGEMQRIGRFVRDTKRKLRLEPIGLFRNHLDFSTNNDGQHTHGVKLEGSFGDEVRPKSCFLNMYVKVL